MDSLTNPMGDSGGSVPRPPATSLARRWCGDGGGAIVEGKMCCAAASEGGGSGAAKSECGSGGPVEASAAGKW